MLLTVDKIYALYNDFKANAQKCFEKSNYNESLQYLVAAAETGFHFYLGYKDDEIELLLQSLSHYIKKKDENRIRNENVSVFYDSFSLDNGGLVQQYLDALIECGQRIIYITEKVGFTNERSDIRTQLTSYGNVEIIEIPARYDYWQKAQFVYDTIIESDANKIFIHTVPDAAFASSAFYALPRNIKKYKINSTDHTFWIGVNFIDYSFEFRQFGMVLSVNERGISEDKILCLPYYPIINKASFEGFPKEADGKVVLFSGGHYYKIFDKDDTFFKISKAILNACPGIIILFAGRGQRDVLNRKLESYNMKDRFIPIGQRKDIAEVFKHCDIYMNTYPIGGGLMLLYAAQLGKPIVCYRSRKTAGAEDIVCQINYFNISDDEIDSLVERVRKLVGNTEYRKQYGEKIKECIVSRQKFNQLFTEYLNTGKNQIIYDGEVDYERHTKDINDRIYYDNLNKQYQRSVIKIFGLKSIWKYPVFFLDAVKAVIKDGRFSKMLRNNIKLKV